MPYHHNGLTTVEKSMNNNARSLNKRQFKNAMKYISEIYKIQHTLFGFS